MRILKRCVGCVLSTHRLCVFVAGAAAPLALLLVIPAAGLTQDVMGLFHLDPFQFFSGVAQGTWVGTGRFFMTDYSDTMSAALDSTGRTLLVRRVLVNEDDTVVVSRGTGIITVQPGDSVFALQWNERRYPPVTGHMSWVEGQWVISFDGEWSAWSIRVRYGSPYSIVAAAARTLGALPPVEFTTMTYRSRPAR